MIELIDFGLGEYDEILSQQKEKFDQLILSKRDGLPGKEYLMIGEHSSVITIGRRGKISNLLQDERYLSKEGIKVHHITRGGDITYHNPGQIILYPIIDLERHGFGVKTYVEFLEKNIIELLSLYGIKGEVIEGATGVWLGAGTPNERKICAIGIKCSRFCTMHGLSLNVNNDLTGFTFINPCGFQDKGVTSIEQEIGQKVELKEVKERLINLLSTKLG